MPCVWVVPGEKPAKRPSFCRSTVSGATACLRRVCKSLARRETLAPGIRSWFQYPLNHLLAVKLSLLREHDWLAAELSTLFERARCFADGSDPAPWNSEGVSLLLRFCAQQGLTPQPYSPETLVASYPAARFPARGLPVRAVPLTYSLEQS